MPSWADEIDYDSVLYEFHCFFKDYPSIWWKGKGDTPIRTIKTILYSMAKIKGGKLMHHLGKIPNTADSELETYMLRLLKSLKIEEVKPIKDKEAVSKLESSKVSRAVHASICDIFSKIGKKEQAEEGFLQLHHFLREHTEVDLNACLAKSSDVFQEYVHNGLKSIEASKSSHTEGKWLRFIERVVSVSLQKKQMRL